jgi:hypothetical protein
LPAASQQLWVWGQAKKSAKKNANKASEACSAKKMWIHFLFLLKN